MDIFRKAKSAAKVFRAGGFHGIAAILRTQYGLPLPQNGKSKWVDGLKSEIAFWDAYIQAKGLQWAEDFRGRLDPDLLLQPRPAALISPQTEVHILDVGAGPLTYLGKKHKGQPIKITAVDPLADEYDRILDKYCIQPLVRTKKLDAENLTKRFPSNTFDLVFARNCLDHAYNPEKAVLQLIEVVKRSQYVLLEHFKNEAEHANYGGLHQWNFDLSADGDFLISSKYKTVNMTQKYANICNIMCEIVTEGDVNNLLVTRIQKKDSY
jgi:SAM-dependent methyltransferase